MHVLHPAPLGALPLEGNYPKPHPLNPGRPPTFRRSWSLFSFVSFHFGLLGLHFSLLGLQFVDFSLLGISFTFGLLGLPFSLQFLHFSVLGLHFFTFWPWAGFPVILAFWDHFGVSIWPRGFHFGLLKLQGGYPLHLRGSARGASEQVVRSL